VVKDDEDFGDAVKIGKEGEDAGFVGGSRGFGHSGHEGRRLSGREVVDAHVEDSRAPGNGPLSGDGDVVEFRLGAEEGAGLDGVVVGEGDEGVEAEVFDLAGFDLMGEAFAERGGPVGAVEVEGNAGGAAAVILLAGDPGAEGAVTLKELADKAEVFARVAGVAVEGNSATKLKGGVSVLRQCQ